MRVAIISAGVLPVPPVKGGAVENTIQTIVDRNNLNTEDPFILDVYSVHDDAAVAASEQYKDVGFCYIDTRNVRDRLARAVKRILLRFKGEKLPPHYTYIKKICGVLREKKYDVVVVHNRASFMPLLKAEVGNTILYLHNDYLNKDIENAKLIADSSDLIICNSDFIRGRVMDVQGVDANKVITILNAIDIDAFSKKDSSSEEVCAFKENLGIPKDDLVVAFVGRVQPIKGVKELLSACTVMVIT